MIEDWIKITYEVRTLNFCHKKLFQYDTHLERDKEKIIINNVAHIYTRQEHCQSLTRAWNSDQILFGHVLFL